MRVRVRMRMRMRMGVRMGVRMRMRVGVRVRMRVGMRMRVRMRLGLLLLRGRRGGQCIGEGTGASHAQARGHQATDETSAVDFPCEVSLYEFLIRHVGSPLVISALRTCQIALMA
jgi:hypothetical protein